MNMTLSENVYCFAATYYKGSDQCVYYWTAAVKRFVAASAGEALYLYDDS